MRFIVFMLLTLITVPALFIACSDDDSAGPSDDTNNEANYKFSFIPPEEQRSGNAADGFDYLVGGSYLSSGIPLDVFRAFFPPDPSNPLGRDGDNASLPYFYSAVEAPNGVKVVSQNCLLCHATTLNGSLVVGLGTTSWDFTQNSADLVPFAEAAIRQRHGDDSPEMEAFQNFRRAVRVSGPQIRTKQVGLNPADKLTFVLASHRDPVTLEWRDDADPPLPPPSTLIPSDVPAWWLLKKKHAMFYAGIGRGDFSRLLMAASILTLQDSSEARAIDRNFGDVLAYIYSLEPPSYPQAINAESRDRGEVLFGQHCSVCHGSYGDNASYPNLMVAHETIGTDPLLAESYHDMWAAHINQFNTSWFGRGEGRAQIVAGDGYVAPPLDGVWATAPYLHNGSVPTLDDMLNSRQRPAYWRRSFDDDDYDYSKVGWNYRTEEGGGDIEVYDTSLPGHSNSGHSFGDVLTDAERSDLIEYLKSL